MEKIYVSLSSKYTDEDIKRMSGVTNFASFTRLKHASLFEAARIKDNEDIVGIVIDNDGITSYIETK